MSNGSIWNKQDALYHKHAGSSFEPAKKEPESLSADVRGPLRPGVLNDASELQKIKHHSPLESGSKIVELECENLFIIGVKKFTREALSLLYTPFGA